MGDDGLRDVKSMTLWELAQAIAINSDEGTYLAHKPTNTDEEDDANQRAAQAHYDRRNACVREIRDREAAALIPRDATGELLREATARGMIVKLYPLGKFGSRCVLAAQRSDDEIDWRGWDARADTPESALRAALDRAKGATDGA
jgi:hypothetical protein